jgi:hypothetical protein
MVINGISGPSLIFKTEASNNSEIFQELIARQHTSTVLESLGLVWHNSIIILRQMTQRYMKYLE